MPLMEDEDTLETQIPEENTTFICAMCKFSTINEECFLNHPHIGNFQNNPLWCENCEKHFTHPRILISHIKERNCVKEENTYYCGTQGCVFQCTSICLFYKHLRASHKHNFFIFCHQCRRKFTVPTSLILHMQNDCLLGNKNRDSGSVQQTKTLLSPVTALTSVAAPPASKPRASEWKIIVIDNDVEKSETNNSNVSQKLVTPAVNNAQPQKSAAIKQVYPTSHLADVTSSTPDTISNLETSSLLPQNPLLEDPVPKTLHCPCCSFSAESQLLLENHYLVEHSGKKRNSCSVCHITFETINLFFSHFSRHYKEDDNIEEEGSKSPSSNFSDSSDSDDPSWCPKQTSNSPLLNQSTRRLRRVSQTKPSDLDGGSSVVETSPNSIESTSKVQHIKSHRKNSIGKNNPLESNDCSSKTHQVAQKVESLPGKNTMISSEPLNKVPRKNLGGKKRKIQSRDVSETSTNKTSNNVHKIKSFEELKSPSDIVKMQSEQKLKHFFKCSVYDCTYTTDDKIFYLDHIDEQHKSDKIYCSYCFQQSIEGQILVEHMLQGHSRRIFQCGSCFYRACSKLHVQRHIKSSHDPETAKIYFCNSDVLSKYFVPEEEEKNVMATTYSYVCTVATCQFKSFSSKEFIEHNNVCHQFVSQLSCFYCQSIFFSPKLLVNHYRMHGMDSFQCVYCIHGSTSLKDIHLHQCVNHADRAFNIYNRNIQKVVSPKSHRKTARYIPPSRSKRKLIEVETLVDEIQTPDPSPVVKKSPSKKPVQHDTESHSSLLAFQTNHIDYPKEIPCLDKNILCRMSSCGNKSKNFASYLKHMKEDHLAINILCPYCHIVCEDSTHFENHMMCHGPNLYECCIEDCRMYSFRKRDVSKHMYTSHQLQCAVTVVRENLNYKLNLFELEAKAFPKLKTKARFYICPFCYYKSSDFKHMKNHMYAELIYKRFECCLCKRKICSRKACLVHFSVHHLYHNVKCEINSIPEVEFLTRTFLTPDIQNKFIEYLQSNHIGSGDILHLKSEYECEECCLRFKDVSEWQYHWVFCVTKGNRLYTCNHCDQQFSNTTLIERHTVKDHPNFAVYCSTTENILPKQTIFKKLQVGKLQFLKSMLIPYLKHKNLYDEKLDVFQLDSKYYRCGYCNFDDTFRYNIQKHLSNSHEDKSSVVKKIKIKSSVNTPNPKYCNMQDKEKTNSSFINPLMESELEKPYCCSFCDIRVQTLEELNQHVANTHDISAIDSYMFFYFPDLNQEFSEESVELYQCAYCSVSQENLFHLKRHHTNLHSKVSFQVRGRWSKNSPKIQCPYCDLKAANHSLLKTHCSLVHPKKNKKIKIVSNVIKPSVKRKFASKIIRCPCCEFSSHSLSSLKLHYTTLHCDNNFCLTCHVKLKTINLFVKHWRLHKKKTKKKKKKKKFIKSSDVLPKECDSRTEGIETIEEAPVLLYKNVEGVVSQNFVPHEEVTHPDPVVQEPDFTKDGLSGAVGQNKSLIQNNSQPLTHNSKTSPKSSKEKPLQGKNSNEDESLKVHKKNIIYHEEKRTQPAQFDHPEISSLNSSSSVSPSSREDFGVSHYGCKPEPVDLYTITVRCGEPPNDISMPIIHLFEQFAMSPLVYVKDFAR